MKKKPFRLGPKELEIIRLSERAELEYLAQLEREREDEVQACLQRAQQETLWHKNRSHNS